MQRRDGQQQTVMSTPVHCQGPRRDYSLEATLHGLVEVQVARIPDAIAIIDAGRKLSYRELDQQASALASILRQRGVTCNQPVAVLLEASAALPVALLGILKAGGGYLALDPSWPPTRLHGVMTDSQVTMLISASKHASLLEQTSIDCVWIDAFQTDQDDCSFTSFSEAAESVPAGSLAYVLYTSGTTGSPKGVMISHGAATNRLFGMQEIYRLSRTDVVLQKTPISFDVSVWEIFWTLMAGAKMVIPPPNDRRDVGNLINLIKAEGVTTLHFTPPALDVFLQFSDAKDCTSIRHVFCGGQSLTTKLQTHFYEVLDAELHHLYGPTETTIDVTSWACQRNSSRLTVPIGKPVPNVCIYVLDPERHPVNTGEKGEIYIGGRQVASGYLNRPDLTQERFIPNPFSHDADARLYRTGDFGRWLSDGSLEFLGRIDHQIKLRGYRIELGEIETTLGQHPQIRQCAVLLLHRSGSSELAAFYSSSETDETTTELREFLSRSLPEFMIPAHFIRLRKLPLTRHGKIDRERLAREADSADYRRSDCAAGVIPNRTITATETRLITIWNELLSSPISQVTDDFFLHGGDSLMVNRASIRIEQQFGVRIHLSQFFEATTVEKLARLIEDQQADCQTIYSHKSDSESRIEEKREQGTDIPKATAIDFQLP